MFARTLGSAARPSVVALALVAAEAALLSPATGPLGAGWPAHLALDAVAVLALLLLARRAGRGPRGVRGAAMAAARASFVFLAAAVPMALARGLLHARIDAAVGESRAGWFCSARVPEALWDPPAFDAALLGDAARLALLDHALALPVLLAPLVFAWARRTPRAVLARRVVNGLALGAVATCAGIARPTANAQAVPTATACAPGSPERAYAVSAIHVDMPLNRFGDRDPDAYMYVLDANIAKVRAQEATPFPDRVSTGLRKDPIQPLAIRARAGECLVLTFTNRLDDGEAALHVHGLAHTAADHGGAVGDNPSSFVPPGGSITTRIAIPADPTAEGAYYFHDHGDSRQRVSHGLFGAVIVEPAGATWRDPETGEPSDGSNWEAIIQVPGEPDFREFVLFYHEVGDEDFTGIVDASGAELPQVDDLSGVYRPAGRALNYRSEPFMRRLQLEPDKSHGYGSYMFGDPATPIPRSYLKEPTKTRLLHGGSEVFHVHHLHGGGDRWRRNPDADPNNTISGGLDKKPADEVFSVQLDSQAIGPGSAYDLEHECGAGGCQQAAGDFLYHCHIGHHYVAGMWSFWRVFDTEQPDLATLPDMSPPPTGVPSTGLVGLVVEGRALVPAAEIEDPATEQSLEAWIERQLPPPGVRLDDQDATVWDWQRVATADGPLYLGEPETTEVWPNYRSSAPGDRPVILFNPTNGRYAWPLFRPHLGKRPPFAGNGHTGAPWLGEDGSADRPDGLCPSADLVPGAGTRHHYPLSAVSLTVPISRDESDPLGQLFVLNEHRDALLAGTRPAEPLVLRANVGDCVRTIFTNDIPDGFLQDGFPSKVNKHIHFVQFDPQGSDGVVSGLSYEQSLKPYRAEGRALVSSVTAGATTLQVNHVDRLRPGVWIGVGLGEGMCGPTTPCTEIRQIASIAGTTITLALPLALPHDAGERVGVEFVQALWYADVDTGTVFFHDHGRVSTWDHGLFGALIIEPAGSTWHDPTTGAPIRSGVFADIHAPPTASVGWGQQGSFREAVLFQHSRQGDAAGESGSFNLRFEPLDDRGGEPAYRFSSVTHGDPFTPIPRAYVGDPFVIRHMGVVEQAGALRLTGHRFRLERWAEGGRLGDASPVGISSRFDLVLDGGAGGPEGKAGDFLYYSATQREFLHGAWGLFRVHDTLRSDLQPLPGRTPPSGTGFPTQGVTGGAPLAAGPAAACPAGAPTRSYDVRLEEVDIAQGEREWRAFAFLPGLGGSPSRPVVTEPLVLRVAAGECLVVNFRNLTDQRASFSPGVLRFDPQTSYGAAIGFNRDSTTAPGATRTYRFYADRPLGSAFALDLGQPENGADGTFAAVVVEPAGATWTDPVSGVANPTGIVADVRTPDGAFRELVALVHDDDPRIGQNTMPYPTEVDGFTGISWKRAPFEDRAGFPADVFSAGLFGPPDLRVAGHAGDPLVVRLSVPWGEQGHVLSVEGHRFPFEPGMPGAEMLAAIDLLPGWSFDLEIAAMGGPGGVVGDNLLLDHRAPFTEAGLWGLVSTLPAGDTSILPLPETVVCGDAVVDAGEACDDGNGADGDGCSALCEVEVCGDGVVQAGLGEACDDGNVLDEDGCSADCVVEACGDGVLQAGLGEACDDGNEVDGDGCSAECVVEACGDGVVQAGLGEACDDGNAESGDGCSADCQGELCAVDLRAFAWSVFAEQDLTARTLDVGGPVAAGRKMNLRGFTVAEEVDGAGFVGAVADDLRLENGQVHGNAVWRTRQTLRRVTFPDGGRLVRDRAFDFRGPWTELEALVVDLAAIPANGRVAVTPGGVTLTGTDPLLNVFDVPATSLQRTSRLTVDAPEGSTAILRVRGRNVSAVGVPMVLAGVVPEEVLLLFPGATSVNLAGSALAATVVAPDATVNLDGAELTGAVLARGVLAEDAVLFDAPFDGGLPCP